MLNRVVLQGRLVADPELRHTQSGTPVATFRIACDRGYKSKDPNAQSADFINIVAWRQTAEFISRYFTKGSMILIDGRLQVRDYTDNAGNRRNIAEVVAENVNFAASKRETGGGYGQQNNNYNADGYAAPQQSAQSNYSAPAAYTPNNAAPVANEFAELNDDDGELPF
ncbi:MAG: single-stranded DNA-binding protein [Clostridiales bacterium]|nr:single-stranded DNA-binding protein [Clostridiales bacterium]